MSVMTWFSRHSVALHDAGVRAGMSAGRQKDHDLYSAHMRVVNGVYGVHNVHTAYSQGFIAGYNAVTSGVMF